MVYELKEDIVNCEEIKQFVEIYKYPLLKRLNMNFIRRLQSEKKTLVIAAIDNKSIYNRNFLNSSFKKVALENRNYVFSNLDYDEDTDILSHLRVSKSENPVIIIYNFSNRRFFVDNFVYSFNEDENTNHLNSILFKLNNNELYFSSGNWIEDFLESIGIKLNHTTVIALVIGSFAVCLIIFMILLFYCSDTNEETQSLQKDKISNQEIDKNDGLNESKKNK